MPSYPEDIAMRFLSWKQLKDLVPYTRQHIGRLETQGRFPKRVRLGNGPRGRVAWIEEEVLDWCGRCVHRRDEPIAATLP